MVHATTGSTSAGVLKLAGGCADAVPEDSGDFALARVRILGPVPLLVLTEEIPELIRGRGVTARLAEGGREIFLVAPDAQARERVIEALRLHVRPHAGVVQWGSTTCAQTPLAPDDCSCLSAASVRPEPARIIEDPASLALFQLAERVARGPISVLVLGETGVGKELVCEAIHRASPRAERPLVRVNCAALTDTLVESTLFGHEVGAFTGATAVKRGLLECAHRGTVFLDEVAELTLATQSKILRVIEQREVFRLGSTEAAALDVRFVAATHRDLRTEVACGRFREDLYYRLAGVTLQVPPLRARPGDILPLARRFLSDACDMLARAPLILSAEAERTLLDYAWPGNVRELKHTIQRAALLCTSATVEREHLVASNGHAAPVAEGAAPTADETAASDDAREEQRWREHVLGVLDQCGGNQTRAADRLKVSRQTLIRWLTRLEARRPRKPSRIG